MAGPLHNTNKMETSRNQVSYREAPNEKNRSGHKNSSLPPAWQNYDIQDTLAFLHRTSSTPALHSFPFPYHSKSTKPENKFKVKKYIFSYVDLAFETSKAKH